MKKSKTIQQRAEQIGITRQTLSRWRKEGTDIFSDDEVRARLAGLTNIPSTVADEFMPTAPPPAPGMESQTLADLERRLLDATDYAEARTLRAQVGGIRDLIRARKESGELISKADYERGQFGVGMAIRMAIFDMAGTLPPVLEGLSAPKIGKAMNARFREVLTRVADFDREYWPDDEELEEFIEKRSKQAI